jgi:predicted metal-dependent hydrolase
MDYPSAIQIGEKEYKVLYENALKRTSSVRIKNGAVVLKLSRFTFGRSRDEMVSKFLKWAEKKLKKVKKSDYGDQTFENGTSIVTHNKVYELKVNVSDGRRKCKLTDGGVIEVSANKKSEVRELVEKTIIKDQTPYLMEVIEELNQLYFQKKYNLVRFKRISSRFGSCSSKGNINIALRLLFSPKEIFKYVCIHELAHLKEMNHSKSFWALVEEAMPEYKDAEKWLRDNGFMLG